MLCSLLCGVNGSFHIMVSCLVAGKIIHLSYGCGTYVHVNCYSPIYGSGVHHSLLGVVNISVSSTDSELYLLLQY